MSSNKQINFLETAKRIIKLIDIIVDNSITGGLYYGKLTKEIIKKIIEDQKLFEYVNLERIIKIKNKFIKLEEYDDNEVYYNMLYDLLLNKIYNFNSQKSDYVILFKSYNSYYYYKKYIKYMSVVINKYPNIINDDIIKEKLFEIVNCLNNDDAIYKKDFYFYLAINHIKYHYKLDNSINIEFKTLNDKFTESRITENILSKINNEKYGLIKNLILMLKYIKSNEKLNEFIIDIDKIVKKKVISDVDDFENINWNILYDNTEIKFIEYLNNNKTNNDVIDLYTFINENSNTKEKFEFYYINKMNNFFSLSIEDKYVMINSIDDEKKFYSHCCEYYSSKCSYEEGMQKDKILKDTVENIIESDEFFNEIKDILKSNKVKNYCKNPIQYIKSDKTVLSYNEKDEEIKRLNKNNKERIISKFNSNINVDDNEPIIDIFNILDIKENKEKDIESFEKQEENSKIQFNIDEPSNKEKEYKCQLELDYEYFINNIFDKNFFKNRIIYSFLPINIKAFVSNIPKIVINICGNNITSFKFEKNTEEYKKILKALYICILIHEIIHYIRRINPKKKVSNEFEYTPISDSINYEGGKSFTYHIFGEFIINYIDLDFAKAILNINNWENNNDSLKNEYSKLKKKDKEEILEYMEKTGGIRCYDSSIEEKKDIVGEEDYYCC